MTTTLNEIELADRWGMSPKTLQRWRNLNVGPEYRKLGKKIMYPLADVEDYENLVRSNFAGIEEILLYLQHAGGQGSAARRGRSPGPSLSAPAPTQAHQAGCAVLSGHAG